MRIPAFLPMPGDAIEVPSSSGLAVARLTRLIRGLLAEFRRRQIERLTLAEIERLDAATLRDIGVNPAQLRAEFHIARERAHARDGGWLIRP